METGAALLSLLGSSFLGSLAGGNANSFVSSEENNIDVELEDNRILTRNTSNQSNPGAHDPWKYNKSCTRWYFMCLVEVATFQPRGGNASPILQQPWVCMTVVVVAAVIVVVVPAGDVEPAPLLELPSDFEEEPRSGSLGPGKGTPDF